MTIPLQPPHAAEGLSVRGIGKRYGQNVVLEHIDFDVRPGEVIALLGENGAGKSTLSSVIAGLVKPDAGTMTWQGQPYLPLSPGDAIQHGIGLIHQETKLLNHLSIAENVFLGRLLMKGGRLDRREMEMRAEAQLKRLGLNVPASRLVGTLQVAAKQQVEIAKALTLNARLLILDEPTAALGGDETDHLFAQVEALKAEGVSFIYISHRLEEIARIADRVAVLRDGRLVAQHDTSRVPVRTLVEQMVGRSVDRLFPPLPAARAEEVLRVEGLTSTTGAFHDVSFEVHAGEIFGIAGIVGAGRTELVRAISGADLLKSGQVRVGGQVVRLREPEDAIRAGVVLVPEDRKAQGVLLDGTIADNLSFANLDNLSKGGWISPSRARAFAQRAIERLGVKGRIDDRAGSLSGGNQQKVVISKWISRDPKLFILDEPTRGIDVGARAAIYEVIADLARGGMAVIVVSSDLEEVLGLAHRVMVLARGRNMGILDRADASGVAVMELATA